MSPNPILCVDDDSDVLESLRILLDLRPELEGIFFEAPLEAIDALEAGLRPAIALVDIRMPKISGIEFMARLREISPETIRVNMSSHADIEIVLEAMTKNNIFGFIRKPISSPDLTATLHKGLQTFKLQQERDRLSKDLEEKNRILEEWNQKLDQEVKNKTLELQIRDDLMQHLSGCRALENPFSVIDRFTQIFLPDGAFHAIYRRKNDRFQLVHSSKAASSIPELAAADLGFKGPRPDPVEWARLLKMDPDELSSLELLQHHGHPLGVWVISGSSLMPMIKTQVQTFTPLVSLLLYDIVSLEEASFLVQQNDLLP